MIREVEPLELGVGGLQAEGEKSRSVWAVPACLGLVLISIKFQAGASEDGCYPDAGRSVHSGRNRRLKWEYGGGVADQNLAAQSLK